MELDEVTLSIADGVGEIVLNRPDQRVGADDEQRAEMMLDPVRRSVGGKPVVFASIESSAVGSWSTGCDDAVFCRGVRSAVRGLAAMTEHVAPIAPRGRAAHADAMPRPTEIVDSEIGPIVAFDHAMHLLTEAGIEVAPWVLVDSSGGWDRAALGADVDRVVVKLADVAHRTELGAGSCRSRSRRCRWCRRRTLTDCRRSRAV